MADLICCVQIQMHLQMPYNLCPCRAASAKAGGNGKGWKGAINFGPSGKQHPVDSAIHHIQFFSLCICHRSSPATYF